METRKRLHVRHRRKAPAAVLAPPPAPPSREREPSDPVAVRKTLHDLVSLLQQVCAMGDRALEDLGSMKLEGALSREEQIVRSCVAAHVLGRMAALDVALQSVAELHSALVPLRKGPSDLLQWAAKELHLEPHMRVGQDGDVARAAANSYEWEGALPESRKGKVTFEVLEPGWTWRGVTVAKPRVVAK